jgi:hypothetical protein
LSNHGSASSMSPYQLWNFIHQQFLLHWSNISSFQAWASI